jgi:hypothetical protein
MEKLFRPDETLDDELELEQPHRRVPGRAVPSARIVRARPPRIFRVAAEEARRRDRNGVARGADAAIARAASSSGAPLPGHLRDRFEASLDADLSRVRVHTGADSAVAAEAVGALAYTTGQDIHFADGRYAPDDPFGLHLLAHEVAHTVQQADAPAHQNKLEVSTPGDALEVEADRAADAMVAGAPAQVSGGTAIAARSPAENQSQAAADTSSQGATPANSPTGDPGSPPNAANDSASGNAGKGDAQSSQKVKVVVNVTPKAGPPISFDAPTYLELYKQVSARADADGEAGSCTCEVAADYKTTDDKVTDATYTATITTSLPQWNQLAQQSPEDQAKFKTWLASVTAHEAQHAKLYTDGYNKLKSSVIGPKENDCETQYKSVDDDVKKAQKAFDADKSKQPAPLPPPGGVTKVP